MAGPSPFPEGKALREQGPHFSPALLFCSPLTAHPQDTQHVSGGNSGDSEQCGPTWKQVLKESRGKEGAR